MTEISIHALLAESDQLYINRTAKAVIFLSTLSLRRATIPVPWLSCCHPDFYPRSPCGERLGIINARLVQPVISIHALLAESDFLHPERFRDLAISIHALLAESDPMISSVTSCRWPFLSTLSLRRATGLFMLYDTSALIFLSTLSLRRATP